MNLKACRIDFKEFAAWQRYDNKYRTCRQLKYELIANNLADAKKAPLESTIARFLSSVNLDRRTLTKAQKPDGKVRLAFEADYPNQIWMIDTKGENLLVEDPTNKYMKVVAKPIVAIDDYSRYVVFALYVYENQETEDNIMHLMKTAISRFGIPDTLYCDRGGPYMGNRMKKSLELLGCKVLHTQKRDAAAKGVVERIMPFFTEKLDSELMVQKDTFTIAQVNSPFTTTSNISFKPTNRKSLLTGT
jgi:transposase InsO family protein